jgi:hypothetical protein
LPRDRIEPSDIGDVGRDGLGTEWSNVVAAAEESGEPLGMVNPREGGPAGVMPAP